MLVDLAEKAALEACEKSLQKYLTCSGWLFGFVVAMLAGTMKLSELTQVNT